MTRPVVWVARQFARLAAKSPCYNTQLLVTQVELRGRRMVQVSIMDKCLGEVVPARALFSQQAAREIGRLIQECAGDEQQQGGP
jgi:hypothetical protein